MFAKAPFAGPQAVLEYLGSYTHKVAISNHRILSLNKQQDTVTFSYKDYADEGKQKQMTLQAEEFIRRFSQHILPKGFTKIRTYGYLANRNRHRCINAVLQQMQLPTHPAQAVSVLMALRLRERYGVDVLTCPCCGQSNLELVAVYFPWKQADDG